MATVMERYGMFAEQMNNEKADATKVFKPLNQKLMQELYLIREVSKTLQEKKDTEISKAKAEKEEAEKQKKNEQTEVEEEPKKEDS